MFPGDASRERPHICIYLLSCPIRIAFVFTAVCFGYFQEHGVEHRSGAIPSTCTILLFAEDCFTGTALYVCMLYCLSK